MLNFENNEYLKNKRAGVLLPLSSMRSDDDFGCGDMLSLQDWIKYLSTYQIKILQILPIWETAPKVNCPYSALTAFAIDPVYINIPSIKEFQKSLRAKNLLETYKSEIETLRNAKKTNFEKIKNIKYALLWEIYQTFETIDQKQTSPRWTEFIAFTKRHASWLTPYAIFRTAKDIYKWRSWQEWPQGLKELSTEFIKDFVSKNEKQIMFFSFIQWIAQEQLENVRKTAKEKGVLLFGDIPFGVNFDSADVWANQSKYLLRAEVGAPADNLAEEGQKWGLPAYNWQVIQSQNFNLWRARIKRACEIYDIFRLDHLVGFFRTWIFTQDNKKGGYDLADEKAQEKRGADFIEAVAETAGVNLPVGEDLGVIPDYMRAYMKQINMAGYRVIRWEKDNETFREPRKFPNASLATTSTHDTPTLKQWWDSMPAWQRANFWEMISAQKTDGNLPYTENVRTEILRRLLGSGSALAIFPLQDLISSEDQINVPGTVNEDNWTYRVPFTPKEFDTHYSKEMQTFKDLIKETNRA